MSPRHEFVRVPRRTYYPVVAPALVETLRLNLYDKWTDTDQPVISDRACVLGTWRRGLAHSGLPTPQVSQDSVTLFIPPKLYTLLVILTTLANQAHEGDPRSPWLRLRLRRSRDDDRPPQCSSVYFSARPFASRTGYILAFCRNLPHHNLSRI